MSQCFRLEISYCLTDIVNTGHLPTNTHAAEHVYLGGTKHDRTLKTTEDSRATVHYRGLQARPASVYPPPLPRGGVPPTSQSGQDPCHRGGF